MQARCGNGDESSHSRFRICNLLRAHEDGSIVGRFGHGRKRLLPCECIPAWHAARLCTASARGVKQIRGSWFREQSGNEFFLFNHEVCHPLPSSERKRFSGREGLYNDAMHVEAHGRRHAALGKLLSRNGVAEQSRPPTAEFLRDRQTEESSFPQCLIVLYGSRSLSVVGSRACGKISSEFATDTLNAQMLRDERKVHR